MIREVSFIIVNSIVPTYQGGNGDGVGLFLVCFMDFRTMGGYFHSPQRWLDYKSFSFFFSFAYTYTTSPAAVMKLVFFFRSSKPLYDFW